jgi:hypothetical protein
MEVFRRHVRPRSVSLIACEAAVIVAAVMAAAYVRMNEAAWMAMSWPELLVKAGLVGITTQVCLCSAELHDLRVLADRRELLVRLVQALGATSLLLGAVYFWAPQLSIGRGALVISAAGIVVAVSSWRLAFEWLTRRLEARHRLLLIGTNGSAVAFARELCAQRELGLQILRFIGAAAQLAERAGEADAARVAEYALPDCAHPIGGICLTLNGRDPIIAVCSNRNYDCRSRAPRPRWPECGDGIRPRRDRIRRGL